MLVKRRHSKTEQGKNKRDYKMAKRKALGISLQRRVFLKEVAGDSDILGVIEGWSISWNIILIFKIGLTSTLRHVIFWFTNTKVNIRT